MRNPMMTAACALFFSIAPASSQPILSNDVILPGDLAAAQAAGKQEAPKIARGSNGFLAVWADNRSSLVGTGGNGPYFGEGLGTMTDIYAARLDTTGHLIDTTPIVLSQAMYNQTAPQVGWNGQSWLVVWMTERQGDRYFNDVVGVRVSPAGVVLDPAPIVINPADTSINTYSPWFVGSDGAANWVVVWRDLDASGSVFTIDAARISPSGVVLDPTGKRLRQDSWNSGAVDASLAFAGDEYLMTWLELDSGTGTWVVRGQRLSPALDAIGGVFKINLYAPTSPTKPAVASDGSGFFVSWSEDRYTGWAQLFGSRVSHTGVVLDPGGIPITAASGYTAFEPDVAWDGVNYVVAYNVQKSFGDDDVYVTHVTPDGRVLEPNGVAVRTGGGTQFQASVTPGFFGGAQVVWNDASFAGDVQSARISGAGTPLVTADLSVGAPRHSLPRIARGASDYLVVYRSEVASESRILAQRLDASGAPIDSEPLRVATGPGRTNPSVAWNGSSYVIVWENAAEGRGQVYARRLSASGVFLDAAPISVMPGRMPDVAALGSTFLVVAADTDYDPHFRYTFAVRMSAAGAVLGTPARIGSNFDVWPRVVAFGSRWLAVWEENVTHDNTHSSVVGAFVGADGVSQGRFVISDGGFDDRPHLAVGNDKVLVAWEDGDVFGRRIAQDGTLFDTAHGIVISGAPEKQFRASVAWDGSTWTVAYLDHRNDPYPNQERGDIFATRVGADGAVLDPAGFPVADTTAPEETPAVVAASGFSLFAYSRFVTPAPFAALRMSVRTSDPASAGGALGDLSGLRAARSLDGTAVDLTWAPSCRAGADYAVYEGTIGAWLEHVPNLCSTGGLTSVSVTPSNGNRYFLVVPHDATTEGSYGSTSSGAQRLASTDACETLQNTTGCP
jgi:hypothetical protein